MKALLFSILLFAPILTHAQGVTIGANTASDASAVLDIVSSSKGVLMPRLTAAARLGITNPATGLLVYQTDAPISGTGSGTLAGYYYNIGTSAAPNWQQLVPASTTAYIQNGTAPQTAANFNVGGNGTVNGTLTVGTSTALGRVQTPTTDTHNMLSAAYGQIDGSRGGSLVSSSGNFTLFSVAYTQNAANVPYMFTIIFKTNSGLANANLSTYPVIATRADGAGYVQATGSTNGAVIFTLYNTSGAFDTGKFNFVVYQP